MKNFILTNGCENAARWAILFFRGEKMHLESPTWGLMRVLCEAFGVEYDEFCYHYDEKSWKFHADKVADGPVYTTDRYNNLFMHENIPLKRGIIDETYTMDNLLDPKRKLEKNKIVIGSFSKFAGCGLRLGYVLFNEEHNDFFQMMREQYINAAAVEYIKHGLDSFERPELIELTNGITVTYHPTYVTFRNHTLNVPHKHFTVDGIDFCRVGRIIHV